MFLQRKFLGPRDRAIGPADLVAQRLPAAVRDVVHNLALLLETKRGVGHVFPDFGFSQSGHASAEGLVTSCTDELRENLARYERRLEALEIEGDVDDDGWPTLVVEARIEGAEGLWRLVLDPARRVVRRVEAI